MDGRVQYFFGLKRSSRQTWTTDLCDVYYEAISGIYLHVYINEDTKILFSLWFFPKDTAREYRCAARSTCGWMIWPLLTWQHLVYKSGSEFKGLCPVTEPCSTPGPMLGWMFSSIKQELWHKSNYLFQSQALMNQFQKESQYLVQGVLSGTTHGYNILEMKAACTAANPQLSVAVPLHVYKKSKSCV